MDRPPKVLIPKIVAAIQSTNRTITPLANKPYMIEGMAESNSMMMRSILDNALGAIFVMNRAVKTEIGKDSNAAKKPVASVFMKIKNTPYSPVSLRQTVPVKNLNKEMLFSPKNTEIPFWKIK